MPTSVYSHKLGDQHYVCDNRLRVPNSGGEFGYLTSSSSWWLASYHARSPEGHRLSACSTGIPHVLYLAGAAGLEPTVFGFGDRCPSQLGHAPVLKSVAGNPGLEPGTF